MKNAVNPVFSSKEAYKVFRAKFSIWLPKLISLDGTDFKDDKGLIATMKTKIEAEKEKKIGGGSGGTAGGAAGGNMADQSLKAKSGNTAFEYNKRAHKKYSSSKSLVERILKSHSEGNRFIRNEDL